MILFWGVFMAYIRFPILFIIFISFFFSPVCTMADIFFVRPATGKYGLENGSTYDDAFKGWKNIRWGNDKSSVGPGDTLFVCGQFQNEYINITQSGKEQKRITIRGDYQRDTGLINALGRSKGIRLDGASFISIIGLTITGARNEGLGCSKYCSGLIVDNVESRYNSGSGFILLGKELLIINSTAHHNSGSGIRVGWSDNAMIINCKVSNNGTDGENHDGIFVGNGSNNFIVESCTVTHQKGQSSFDVSDNNAPGGSTNGLFSKCKALNGPIYGFHSAIRKTTIIYRECQAMNHNYNFQAGLYLGAKAFFLDCTGSNSGGIADWAIQGEGERHVKIEGCKQESGGSKYAIRIDDSNKLIFSENNNHWIGGKYSFAIIDQLRYKRKEFENKCCNKPAVPKVLRFK